MVNGFSAGELHCMVGPARPFTPCVITKGQLLPWWKTPTIIYLAATPALRGVSNFTYLIFNFSCRRKRKERWSSWFCVGETWKVRVLLTRSRSYDLPIISLYELPLTKLNRAARGSDIGFFNPASSWGYFWSNPTIPSHARSILIPIPPG